MGKFINELENKYGRLTVINRAKNYNDRVLWICKCDCGNEKTILGQSLRGGLTKSCGCLRDELTSKRFKGNILSEEAKKKISERNKGYKHTEEARKIMSKAGKGRIFTEETRKKLSITHKGKNNPNWNPNLTDEERLIKRNYPEYIEWRKAVYKRDNYICQICGQVGNKLNAHHLESFNSNIKLRISVSNGITLCESCHKNFHHQYGRDSNTEEQFEEFLI